MNEDENEPIRSANASHGGRAANGNINENCDQRDQRKQNLLYIASLIVEAADTAPPPNATSEHLHDCPHCGRHWLSRLAMLCPTCGYSLQMARDRAHREWQFRWELTIVAVPLMFISLFFTPSLEETAVSSARFASVTYALGNLLFMMSSILTLVTGWMWWKRWRRRNINV